MESGQHDGRQRVRGKRAVDVGRSPSASVHQVPHGHDRLDELALEPLLDVVDDLTRDGRIAAGIEFFRKEPDEIAITPEVTVCLHDIAGERVAHNLSGEIIQLAFLSRFVCARDPLHRWLFRRYHDGPDGLTTRIDKVGKIVVARSTTTLPATSGRRFTLRVT